MMPRWSHAYLFVIAVFISLLLLYTAYDKATKTLVLETLMKVLSFQDPDSSLRELNKVFALEAIGLISIVFLLGPLSKLWPNIFARFLYLRKPVGIIGFLLAAAHGAYALVQVYRLDIGLMLAEPRVTGLMAAFVSLFIFFLMAVTSNKEAVEKLGYRKWKALQTFGYIGLLLALAHFFIYETKPEIGLDVRPYGMIFFYLAAAALLLRLLIVFRAVPERRSYEEHIGEAGQESKVQ